MMNIEKYNKAFMDVFAVEETALDDLFSKETIAEWDSVHQLNVVVNIEEAFDVMLESEDIIALTTYQTGKKILSKYGITF